MIETKQQALNLRFSPEMEQDILGMMRRFGYTAPEHVLIDAFALYRYFVAGPAAAVEMRSKYEDGSSSVFSPHDLLAHHKIIELKMPAVNRPNEK